MFKAIQTAVAGLSRVQLELQARLEAQQIVLEALAQQLHCINDPENKKPFDSEQFRKQITDVTKTCREQIAIRMENIDPAIAAYLDEERSAEDYLEGEIPPKG